MSTSQAALPVETLDPTSSTAALALARRLRPLQVGVALQAFILWVPVEKLFMSGIGFTAATIGIMAAVYAATVPLLEIPSGVAADRWSRTRLMALAGVALAASTLIGGLSQGVGTYVVSAVFLGVYFAMISGTVDSVLYDTLLEATGSGETFDRWLGRIRAQESAALVASAVLGGLLAGWLSPRATYFATVPVTLLSIVFLLRFREPQLHRSNTGTSIVEQTRHTMQAMTRGATVRNAILLGAVTGMLLQAVFEFGPLWLTAVDAPPPLYGPYWAALVSTIGIGAWLAGRIPWHRRSAVVGFAALMAAAPLPLALVSQLAAVTAAQVTMGLALGVLAVRASQLLHESVPSAIRAGVASGVGTVTWALFVPFALASGWLAQVYGVDGAGALFVGAGLLLALGVMTHAGTHDRRQLVDRPAAVTVHA